MKRRMDINEVSEGNLYGVNDMVKADCGDCKGCFSCCQNMGNSIILDPMDIYRISKGTGLDFGKLMGGYIELNMVDGMVLPNLKMSAEKNSCAFLNEKGRCSIHSYRPGICRLFPLGRIYKEDEKGFDYFLQANECKSTVRTKVKVKKWIDTPDIKKYEKFICDWHYFVEETEEYIKEQVKSGNNDKANERITYLLNIMFVMPYDTEADFYEQFYKRLERVKINKSGK